VHTARRFQFGNVCFDEAALLLTVGGQAVELERRALELLGLLLAHAGEVVTKDEIFEKIWPDREVTEASMTKCMARLRQGLGDTDHTLVRTVHGYGYRLMAPVTVAASAAPSPLLRLELNPGDTVPARPNWRLVRRLGSGGYGDAWLGEQSKSHALRVFKFAADGAGLTALRREVTLSRLLREGLGERPDLVRILDWRLDEPPAFVEIDYFEAGNLTEWAAAQGGAASVPMAVRLELAAQIADALAAIHGMAVLHKDLKPGNVLVRLDATGQPAIALTDFGSGRALDVAQFDAFGITRMDAETTSPDGATSSASTHMYRAPELVGGGAPTVLADVFALGVMLFQLAAGDLHRSLAPGWEADITDPLLREDIALAASGDPAKRLADAAELARRLRHLEARRQARAQLDEQAAEAARTRRALELARARRIPLLAMLAVLALGLAGSTALYLRAEREAARAKAVTRFLTDDLLSAANPALAADPNVPVSRVLAVAAADLDRRFQTGSLDRAAIEAAIGSAYAGLADPSRALPLLHAALATLRRRLGDGDAQTQAVRLAMAALAERTVDGPGMRQAGQDLLAAGGSDPEFALSGRYYVLAGNYILSGDATACVAAARPLLGEARSTLSPAHALTLRIQSELAWCLADAALVDEAVPMARDAVALTRQVYGPDHLLVQERRFILGGVLVQAGKADEAIDLLNDVRRRMLAMSGTETEMSVRALNQLGLAYDLAHRFAEAEAAYRQVLAFSVRTMGKQADLSMAALGNLATNLNSNGRPAEAIPLAQQVFAVSRDKVGSDSPGTLWDESHLANDYARAGNLAEAENLFADTLVRARRVFNHGEWDLGMFALNLGGVLAQEGKTAAARDALAESVARLGASLGPNNARTLRARAALAALNGK
jgi:non-specific serine/threonine protein kinase